MTKKGKKKKQGVAAAASTSEDASSETQQQSSQQQQEKQEQILSQVLPGSSQSMQQKVSKSPQPYISQSKQQVASRSQKQQSQPQQQQQKPQDQPQQTTQSPYQQIQQGQQQLQGAWLKRQQPQSQSQQQATQDPHQYQQIQQGQQQVQRTGVQWQQPQGQPQQQAAQGPHQQILQGQQQRQRGVQQQQPQDQQQQLQGAWLKQQQQQQPQSQPQQQAAQDPHQYQQIQQGQQQVQRTGVQWQQPQGQPQQQAAQGSHQQIPQGQQQKQRGVQRQQPQDQQQLQGAWLKQQQQQQPQSQPQQQAAQDPHQYQQIQQGQQVQRTGVQWQQPQGQPQQQAAQGPHQQIPQDQQQRQRGIQWQQPQGQQIPQGQQQLQGAWLKQQQQPQGQLQQAAQGSHQQIPQGQLQVQGVQWQQSQHQQQLQGAWLKRQPQGQPQEQAAQDPHQYQQIQQGQQQVQRTGVQRRQPQGQPQQQIPQQVQQQQQTIWSQQQVLQSQAQQQQKALTSTQQQQRASFNGGAAGDRQVQAVGMHPQQPSTSTKSLKLSELGSTDPFSEIIEKSKMSSAALTSYYDMIPKRTQPDKGGSIGIKIEVLTNMFKIIFDNKFVTNAVHYDVTIKHYNLSKEKGGKKDQKKELKLPKTLCRNIFEQFRNKHFKNRYPAYDGKKNAYSANDLPFIDDMADVFEHENLNGRKNQYQIILKKVANVDLSWIKNLRPGFSNRDQTAVQVLDIIMRHAPESRFVNIGRSLFWNINENEPLGGGIALARGGFMSGILGWKPYLNVDVSHKGFTMKQKVLEYITDFLKDNELTYANVIRNKPKLQSFLKGLKVIYEIPNVSKRTYRIIDLSEETSDSVFIQKSDNEERKVTIKQYFSNFKRYNIKRPDLPTLHVSTRADGNKILLPIELCTIMPNQPIRKLNEEQTSNMIKKAATDASTRRRRIEDAFDTIEVNNSPVMTKEFHLSISNEMEKVPARILPAPELRYKERKAQVKKGTWWLQPFKDARNLEKNSWTIVNISGQSNIDPILYEFTQLLQKNANELNMKIEQPCTPFRSFQLRDSNGITNYFNDNKKLKLIIVILPSRTDEIYGKVKKITEMEVGVLTQCIKVQTLRKLTQSKQAATVNNILLKINSKLNGVNHTFEKTPSCLQYPCMLVGADVTHPSPDSKDIPSIAAVAASKDKSAFRYSVALRLQQPKEEMILDLKEIILSQLKIFEQESKCCPKRIIYYRDGVSEGQLPQVMYYEIEAINKAIKEFTHEGKKGNIEITCLVVQKRHHVRLFPTNPRDEIDSRTKNVQAGTIVDTTITHPDHIDFYLVSHASIQGTARPTKYRCIYNQSKFTEDQLEELSFYLCHIYARCTRSVSYPAPTYYAHLGAYRGRALIQGKIFSLGDLEREQRMFKNLKMEESPMFFV